MLEEASPKKPAGTGKSKGARLQSDVFSFPLTAVHIRRGSRRLRRRTRHRHHHCPQDAWGAKSVALTTLLELSGNG